MSETMQDVERIQHPAASASNGDAAARPLGHPANRPIPLWPEGVLAAAAGITLVVIGVRHRFWLQRKATEAKRAVEEFQSHGGLDELTQMARQASDFIKGSG